MRRGFFTVGQKKCPFGCTYCFTEFNDYVRPPSVYSIFEGKVSVDDIDIIYPACDIEFFALKNWRVILQSLVKYKKIIVISTKSILNEDDLNFISQIYKEIIAHGGFLKIGISITTKFNVENIEPKTPSYNSRLKTAKDLYYAGIPICLIMKPLLVDIEDEELNSILNDFFAISNIILTGDEYLDSKIPRNIVGVESVDVLIESKLVGWKEGDTEWSARRNLEQMDNLLNISKRYNLPVALTDVEAVIYLRKKYEALSD